MYLCAVHNIPIIMEDNKFGNKRLHRASRVMPKSELDSVARSKSLGRNRAFEVLLEAQQYWQALEAFRQDRERNQNYTYGRQWNDPARWSRRRTTLSRRVMLR